MMDVSSDNALFFSDLGVPATLHQAGLADKPVQVLFDRNSLGEMGMLTDKPQITIRDSDLAGFDLKAIIIDVAGGSYKLTKPLPDGSGLTLAGLTRA